MISEPIKTAGDIAFRTGAIVPCPRCGLFSIQAHSDDARNAALAMARRAWRSGCRGFRDLGQAEALATVRDVIQETRGECPGCQSLGG